MSARNGNGRRASASVNGRRDIGGRDNGTERPYFAENGAEKIVTEIKDVISNKFSKNFLIPAK
jgi:hypothetical protein